MGGPPLRHAQPPLQQCHPPPLGPGPEQRASRPSTSPTTPAAASRATQGTGAAQRSLAYTCGADGFVQTVTDALTQTVVYQRDAAGRVTQATHPGDRVLAFAYEANNNLVQISTAMS